MRQLPRAADGTRNDTHQYRTITVSEAMVAQGGAARGHRCFAGLPAASTTCLPGIAQLEVRIGALVPMPIGVMVRCVDAHPGRPFLARRLSIAPSVRSLLGEGLRRENGAKSDNYEKLVCRTVHDIILSCGAAFAKPAHDHAAIEDALTCCSQV